MPRLTASIQFRLDKELHEKLHRRAEEEGVSASDMARKYIRRGLSQDKLDTRIIDGLLREARAIYESRTNENPG